MTAVPVQPGGPPPEVFVTFSAEVNPNTTESLIACLSNMANNGVPKVTLLLSTPGGSVMNGINLYNVLRAMPFELITHNVGNVDSIGNAIFLAGSQRLACAHSTFMFHGVGFDFPQGIRLEQAFLEERLENILADQKRIGGIIQERTTLTEEQIADLFRGQRTKDAAYAVGCGIVHEIKEVNVPTGIPVISLVFQR